MGKNKVSLPQRARVEIRIGADRGLAAEVALTPAGLWAVVGIVGTALIGSAAIVWVSRRPVQPASKKGGLTRLEHPPA